MKAIRTLLFVIGLTLFGAVCAAGGPVKVNGTYFAGYA